MRFLLARLLIVCFLYTLSSTYAENFSATKQSTFCGSEGVLRYTQARHGPDGALFLDPFFLPFLQDVQDQIVLDAGCGAAPWAIVAAKNGAFVYGVDIEEKMINQGHIAIRREGLESQISLSVDDVNALPFPDEYFDKAISINVGCALPTLNLHIKELKRVMKHGSLALLTSPHACINTLFTNGTTTDYKARIQALLKPDAAAPHTEINSIDEVYRATFVWRDNMWSLITPDTQLAPGEKIWRKLPNLLVLNYYHSEEEYLQAFKDAGFIVKQIMHPCFHSAQELQEYNKTHQTSLGAEYISHSPFILFIIEKP